MNKWLAEAATVLATGAGNHCQRSHPTHDTITVDVDLDGPTGLADLPSFPPRLQRHFNMEVWDWRRYANSEGYCPGDDGLSQSVDLQGIWEGWETLIVLDLLSRDDPATVLDFGAHVGWYSLLAALAGHGVLAIDADKDCLDLLEKNAAINGIGHQITTTLSWVDQATPPLAIEDAPQIRLLKIDVEGLEDQVLRVCRPLLEAGLVDFVLLEVSPVFAPHYPDTVEAVVDFGYDAYWVPNKSVELARTFGDAPLEGLKEFHVPPEELRASIKQVRQQDMVLVKGGLL